MDLCSCNNSSHSVAAIQFYDIQQSPNNFFFFFPRYKKNLKALYVVHPTNFIKILWNIFKPLIRYLAIYSTHFPVLFKDGMFSNKLLLKRLEVKYVR